MMNKTTSEKPKILFVEDEKSFANSIRLVLGEAYSVTWAEDVQEAMKTLAEDQPDLILLDYDLPNISGVDFLRILRQRRNPIPVIMLTGHSDPETIIETMQAGANDYVIKSQSDLEICLLHRLSQTLERFQIINKNSKLQTENDEIAQKNHKLTEKLSDHFGKYEILGISKETIQLKSSILKLKNTASYVVITGENGTGKELVARNLNLQEDDKTRPFIAVNCASIPHNLFESEFFGHVKGAFTGANENKIGKFEAADGGDIFLDELPEIPLEMQAKLLRVLQEKTVCRVGSNKNIPINVRVIAATNRNLEEEVRKGNFREDLYYRLHQITLEVAPLRKRPEDIEFLANSFIKRLMPNGYFSKDAMDELKKHEWRGNIRELQNTVERAFVFAKNSRFPIIKSEYLKISPLRLSSQSNEQFPGDLLPIKEEEISESSFMRSILWIEKVYFENALRLLNGDNSALYKKINMSKAQYFRRKKSIQDLESKKQDSHEH